MTTTLFATPSVSLPSPATRLRASMAAARLTFTWFGTRKALTPDQKSQAAESFGAERDFFSAGKKLLDMSHPSFRAVTSVRSQILGYWRSTSLPYPEPAIRLIRQDDIQKFVVQMTSLKAELREVVLVLDQHYFELKEAARLRLGRLYNEADYPRSLQGLFEVSWDFPSVEPPDYLRRLSPQLYQQESQRIAALFDEAVELAESAFTSELSKLVTHLSERITGSADGKPKVFRDSAVENLFDFFQRFRSLTVGSNEQLEALVSEAQQIVRGIRPQELRDSTPLRQQLAEQLSGVQSSLDELLVDRPRRNLLRKTS